MNKHIERITVYPNANKITKTNIDYFLKYKFEKTKVLLHGIIKDYFVQTANNAMLFSVSSIHLFAIYCEQLLYFASIYFSKKINKDVDIIL